VTAAERVARGAAPDTELDTLLLRDAIDQDVTCSDAVRALLHQAADAIDGLRAEAVRAARNTADLADAWKTSQRLHAKVAAELAEIRRRTETAGAG
jgi:hypothetical protein